MTRMTRREDSARSGDIYLPVKGAAPSPLAGWDPARAIAHDQAAEPADDHGMEMLAKLFMGGAIAAITLAVLYLGWPVIERLVGGAQ